MPLTKPELLDWLAKGRWDVVQAVAGWLEEDYGADVVTIGTRLELTAQLRSRRTPVWMLREAIEHIVGWVPDGMDDEADFDLDLDDEEMGDESSCLTAAEIGDMTVTAAWDLELSDRIAVETALGVSTVRRRLKKASGNKRIRNLFAKRWPDVSAPDGMDDEADFDLDLDDEEMGDESSCLTAAESHRPRALATSVVRGARDSRRPLPTMRLRVARRRFAWSAAVSVSLVLCAGAAWGQSPEELRQFRMWTENGTDHFRAGRYGTAVTEFRRALTVIHEPGLTWNIARSYEEIGDVGNAVHYFKEFVARYPADPSAPKAKERLEELRGLLPGTVVVECGDAVAAKVLIDGERKVKCGRKVGHLDPGQHSVEVTAPDKQPWKSVFTVLPAAKVVVQVDWSQAGAGPGIGAAHAKAPPPPSPLPTPPKAPQKPTPPEPATVAPAVVEAPAPGPADPPASGSLVPTLTLGAAFGLIVGGATAGFIGVRAQDEYEESKATSRNGGSVDHEEVRRLEDDAELYPVLANVLLASGVVAGAVGAYLLWSEPSGAAARPKPTLLPTPRGLIGRWTW